MKSATVFAAPNRTVIASNDTARAGPAAPRRAQNANVPTAAAAANAAV